MVSPVLVHTVPLNHSASDVTNDSSVSGTTVKDALNTLSSGSSSGDVVGPSSSVDSDIVLFNGTTGKLIKDSGQTIAQILSPYVPQTRTISTTSPITGGGDLSTNRTIAIPVATTSADGYLSSIDWTTFNGKAGLSFVTVSTPAGTSPVADAASDTLTLTASDSKITITGTAATDTIDITAPTLVVGPSSATSTAIAIYNGTTGKIIQNSTVLINASSGQLSLGSSSAKELNFGSFRIFQNGSQLQFENISAESGFIIASDGSCTFSAPNFSVTTTSAFPLYDPGIAVSGTIDMTTAAANIKVSHGGKLTGDATTGFKLLDNTAHKLGFWNATPVVQNTGWGSITNVTPDKAYDANATTVDELADVLGTLIAQLVTYGLLGS